MTQSVRVLGILKADSVNPDLQVTHGDYTDMFQSIFRVADPTLTFNIYDVLASQYPDNIDECDGYLITGSRHSVYEPLPWIQRLGEFVVELHSARKKLLGICFGHQLVAHVLGGRTAKSDRGWGVGRHVTRLYDASHPDWPSEFALLSSHQDQVQESPPDAEIIAQSDFCPIAGMTLGQHILTLQGHPEFTKDYARDLLGVRREVLGESLYQAGLASLAEDVHQLEVARLILDFLFDGPSAGALSAQVPK
jgi:GMP synthase-like glutamine amidotransferase